MFRSVPTPDARRAASRLHSLVLAAAALAGAALLAPACGGGGPTTTDPVPEDCEGGLITQDNVCVAKCSPDKCIADNTCVGNACQLKCDSHKDCDIYGSQDCAPAVEDDTNASILTCQYVRSAGLGTACWFGWECGLWLSCPDNGVCFSNQCAGDPAACVQDADFCKDDPNCIVGKCPDGSGCRVNCTVDCQPWLDCETKGQGDAESYCTQRDCATDADCAGGYYCGIIRDPHEVCGSAPKKGDNSFCGQTSEPCLSPGANGTSLFEGSLCMLRRSCLKRDQGAPCLTDLDCSLIDGQKCAAFAGETRCARTCLTDKDCLQDHACDPGAGACVPRFGKWLADDQGSKFCEPCKTDEDCGGKGSSWACSELSGGMRACFDQSFPDTCITDADCPKSPSGKSGTCLNDNLKIDPGSSVYNRCYLPINYCDNCDGKTTCW